MEVEVTVELRSSLAVICDGMPLYQLARQGPADFEASMPSHANRAGLGGRISYKGSCHFNFYRSESLIIWDSSQFLAAVRFTTRLCTNACAAQLLFTSCNPNWESLHLKQTEVCFCTKFSVEASKTSEAIRRTACQGYLRFQKRRGPYEQIPVAKGRLLSSVEQYNRRMILMSVLAPSLTLFYLRARW